MAKNRRAVIEVEAENATTDWCDSFGPDGALCARCGRVIRPGERIVFLDPEANDATHEACIEHPWPVRVG